MGWSTSKNRLSNHLRVVETRWCEEFWVRIWQFSHLANGPWNKSLNFIFPTKYVIPKSLKFSHWPSKFLDSSLSLRSFWGNSIFGGIEGPKFLVAIHHFLWVERFMNPEFIVLVATFWIIWRLCYSSRKPFEKRVAPRHILLLKGSAC